MGKKLWEPTQERIQATAIYRFMKEVNRQYRIGLTGYDQLYQWSIDSPKAFWESVRTFTDIRFSAPHSEVVTDYERMPGSDWFPGAKLNFAENLMRFRDAAPAIIFRNEAGERRELSYEMLYNRVALLVAELKSTGVKPGDRVAGFMPNIPETVIAMLATTALGGVWTSCSPDFGRKGVLDRFGQIRPKIVVASDGYYYGGKSIDTLSRLSGIVGEIESVERVIIFPYLEKEPDISGLKNGSVFYPGSDQKATSDIQFEQLPFSHPLYIMYSSGTTGLPKCMVQSAGGVLIHHLKELVLHTDIGRGDTVFYYTTCGWMMWNWLVSALSTGGAIVLYDGHPFFPEPGSLWEMTQDEGITVFGTSAGYISALMNTGLKPGAFYDLSSLRTILSTGSPLSEEGFEFVYEHVKQDLQLSSISGGTDLNGCFALGNPMGSVWSGELQCRGLGMRVEAFDESGESVTGCQGELVCRAPFPSMPIYFWNDPENTRYKNAYFNRYENVWHHGDYIEINERGGVKIYGRSDATLNPGGVRIGTAEIYRQVDKLPEIDDSIVIGQAWQNDQRIVLFVRMADGEELTDAIRDRIRKSIRENASPRHTPAKIIAVPEIPVTLNMKKVELAVKKTVEGRPVENTDAIKNPEALIHFQDLAELAEA